MLLLLSTVPSTVLPRTQPALDILFESFWAAWGGRALSGLSSSVASGASTPVEEFAAAFLECLVFESANMHKDEGESAVELVKSWTDRFTRAYLGIDREEGIKMVRSLQTTAVASQLERTLAKLAGKADGECWRRMCDVDSRLTSLLCPVKIYLKLLGRHSPTMRRISSPSLRRATPSSWRFPPSI